MDGENHSIGKGCAVLAAILLMVPLVVVGVVGVRTWIPLQQAQKSLDSLELELGSRASYTPTASGNIPPDRLELFLELRATLVTACLDYGTVQEAFDAVESMDSSKAEGKEVVGTAHLLGSAALSITPFLARFFELRNSELLAVGMGLEEYAYIYAFSYHEQLLSDHTRAQIFSNGDPISREASEMLKACLARQGEALDPASSEASQRNALEAESQEMARDPARLIWQDGLPPAVHASLAPYRDRLDQLFCGATAGLEMERSSRRALRVALE